MKTAISCFLLAALLWLAISGCIFRFRHPWSTETEMLLNVHKAMLLKRVPYDEMRPREARP